MPVHAQWLAIRSHQLGHGGVGTDPIEVAHQLAAQPAAHRDTTELAALAPWERLAGAPRPVPRCTSPCPAAAPSAPWHAARRDRPDKSPERPSSRTLERL